MGAHDRAGDRQHNFTTSAVGAVADFQRLRKNLELNAPAIFDVIVGLSWPSGADLEQWEPDHAALYLSDLGGHYLASARRRDVFTHSLGARVCFEALDQEARSSALSLRWLHTLWCAATAITSALRSAHRQPALHGTGLNFVFARQGRRIEWG